MRKRFAMIDYEKCSPEDCNPGPGVCLALKACKRDILQQEAAHETPMVVFMDMCQGCSDCVRACPLGAIRMKSG